MNASSSNTQPRLSQDEAALVIAGVLGFIASFLTWFSQSASVLGTSVTAATDNGWQVGGEIIFVTLVMMYLAGRSVAAAAGKFRHMSHYKSYAALSAFCLVVIFLRDGTYPSSSGYTNSLGVGSFLGLIATLVATVALVLAATGRGVSRTTVSETAA